MPVIYRLYNKLTKYTYRLFINQYELVPIEWDYPKAKNLNAWDFCVNYNVPR